MEKLSEGIPWRVQWLGLGASTAVGLGWISGHATKIPQAV